METKSGDGSKVKTSLFKAISVVFILVSLYLAFNSASYIWVFYSSIYSQVGLVKTAISLLLTFEVAILGFGFLSMPFINLFSEEVGVKKMFQSNLLAMVGSVLLIEVAFPAWNGLVVLLLVRVFGV